VWVRDDAILLWDSEHRATWHGVLVDVTAQKLLEEQLERQAFHDSLTGLPNRKLFHDRVGDALGKRQPGQIAVLFIDLDNFKTVNDSFGHACGDEVIIAASARLLSCARAGDTAARVGGDEFALLVEDMTVAQVEALDNHISTEAQTALYLAFRRLLDRASRWFLQTRPGTIDVGAEIARFGPVVAELGRQMPELAVGAEYKQLHEDAADFVRMGIPEQLALRGASLLNEFQLLDITEISTQVGSAPSEVAPVYTTLSERYAVDAMLTRISQLDRGDRWQALARAALRYDLYAALEALTVAVITASPNVRMDPRERIEAWERANTAAVARATQTLDEVRRLEKGDLASLSVALRTLRGVVRSTS